MVRISTTPFKLTFGSMPFSLAGRTGLIVEVRYGVVGFDMPITREWLRKR